MSFYELYPLSGDPNKNVDYYLWDPKVLNTKHINKPKSREEELKLLIDSPKELKLRLINEPVTFESNYYTKCCLWCICCIDLVTPLSNEERVIKLVIGFIRKYSLHEMSPGIYLLCIDFVGGPSLFNKKRNQLMSNREMTIDTMYNKLNYTDICDPDEFAICDPCEDDEFAIFPGCLICTCSYFCYLCVEALFIGKDIAALVINTTNHCNNDDKYVSFDINVWIMIGCISHLVYWILYCAAHYVCEDVGRRRVKINWGDKVSKYKNDRKIWPLLFLLGCACYSCFFIAWMVIGLLFWSQMIASSAEECKNVVLSWCILQGIESVTAPIFLCLCQSTRQYDNYN